MWFDGSRSVYDELATTSIVSPTDARESQADCEKLRRVMIAGFHDDDGVKSPPGITRHKALHILVGMPWAFGTLTRTSPPSGSTIERDRAFSLSRRGLVDTYRRTVRHT
jgi:hypothetical protein